MFERKKREQGRLEAVWAGDWRGDNSNNSNSSVLSVHNLQQHSAVFTKLLLNDKLTSSVQQIMENCGEVNNQDDNFCLFLLVLNIQIKDPSVVLHHTKAHLKPSKEGAPFPTHQVGTEYNKDDHYLITCLGLSLFPLQAPLNVGHLYPS